MTENYIQLLDKKFNRCSNIETGLTYSEIVDFQSIVATGKSSSDYSGKGYYSTLNFYNNEKCNSSINVAMVHVKYKGTSSDAAGHAVVVVKDIGTTPNGYYMVNFNSHMIQNISDKDDKKYYITGGPLAKKQKGQNVPDISEANHLVTRNLQGGAPICTLIAASNFKTIFEQCKTMDDVRAKFHDQELVRRLEDVKTLFGKRVINKDTRETVENHIDKQIQNMKKKLRITDEQLIDTQSPLSIQTPPLSLEQPSREKCVQANKTFTDSCGEATKITQITEVNCFNFDVVIQKLAAEKRPSSAPVSLKKGHHL